MIMENNKRNTFFACAIALIVVLFFTDFLFREFLPDQVTINSKIIFGLLLNNNLAILISLLINIIILFLIFRFQTYSLFSLFVLTGAISNLFSRIILHGAIDYIKIFDIPKFNVSDSLILVGLVLFSLKQIRQN